MRVAAIDTETELFDEKNGKFPHNVKLLFVPYCSSDGSAHFISELSLDNLQQLQQEIDLADIVAFHNVRFDLPKLAQVNIEVPLSKISCSLIGFTLLRGPRLKNGLKPLARELLGVEMSDFDESLYESIEAMEAYAKKDAVVTRDLYPVLITKLEEHNLLNLYLNVELPLIPALISLESNGIKINRKGLKKYCRELLEKQKQCLNEITESITPDFNPNSTTQIASYVHNTLGIKVSYTTEKGKSATDVASLEKYNNNLNDKTLSNIIQFLKDSKFLSNQAIPILKKCDPADERLRCTYNPLGTETGRFTASGPNLQGVSKKGPLRSFFISDNGHKLVCADFKQQEPRILAAFTRDKELLKAVESGGDFYKYVASIIHNLVIDEISDKLRNEVKVLILSCIYGKQAPAVASDLKISYIKAKEVLRLFNSLFPGIQEWKNKVITELTVNGYLTTPLGRRRNFTFADNLSRAEINSIEREAINFIIQGTAADVSKIALKRINDSLEPGWKLLAFIHDEYLLEVPDADTDEAISMLHRVMSEKIDWLGICLVADVGAGNSWAEAKGKG